MKKLLTIFLLCFSIAWAFNVGDLRRLIGDTVEVANAYLEEALDFKIQSSTPSNPASGYKRMYCKDDGKCYTLTSDGVEKEVGSGSGAAAGDSDTIVLLKAAEIELTDLDLSGNNAAFDGGGTIDGAVTMSTTAADIILAAQVIKYAASSSSQNDYFGVTVDIPQGLRGRSLGFAFEYRTDSTAVDDDFRFAVKIKDGALAGTVYYEDLEAYSGTDNNSSPFEMGKYIPTDCTQVEIGWQNISATTTLELFVDNILVTASPWLALDIQDADQFLWLQTSNGHGSTATRIRRFLTERMSSGGDLFVYEDSAANGASITLTRECEISVVYNDNFTNASYFGLSLNSSQLTTDIAAITESTRLGISTTGSGGWGETVVFKGKLPAGSVIRPHTEDVSGSAEGRTSFVVFARATSEHVMTPTDYKLQQITISQAGNALADRTAEIEYNLATATIENKHGGVATSYASTKQPMTVSDDSGNTRTLFTANVPGVAIATFECSVTSSATFILFTKNGTNQAPGYQVNGTTYVGSLTQQISMNAGDYLTAYTSGTVYNASQVATVRITFFPDYAKMLGAIPIQETCYIKDVKASGTGGGTSSTSYTTRTLNTLEGDTGWVSLSSNEFTLQKGKYRIDAKVPAYQTNPHKARLYNATTFTVEAIGSSEAMATTGFTSTSSKIMCQIEIGQATTYRIEHRAASAVANGWGVPVGFGDDEVYTQVKITKIK